MKNKETELVCILDKSGSMRGLEKDTIGGFNSLLEKQMKEAGAVRVTTVLFDHRYTLLHKRLPIMDVMPITDKEYEAGGMTALLDAVGRTIDMLKDTLKNRKKSEMPLVLFVIITDGEENASKEYSLDTVRKKIEACKNENTWEFLYLGANVDAFAAASSIGISKGHTTQYHADQEGIRVNFEALNTTVACMRCNQRLDETWKDMIDKDFIKRKNGKS